MTAQVEYNSLFNKNFRIGPMPQAGLIWKISKNIKLHSEYNLFYDTLTKNLPNTTQQILSKISLAFYPNYQIEYQHQWTKHKINNQESKINLKIFF